MCSLVVHFLVKKREFQTYIFPVSVCRRTPRNFTFLPNFIFGMANLFLDTIFHLIQYYKCRVDSKSYVNIASLILDPMGVPGRVSINELETKLLL